MLASVGVIAMTTGLMMMAVPGTANAVDEGEKLNICHRTDNDRNPYTYQRVDANSTQLEGHLDHRTENGGGEDKYWDADGTWNGIPHLAGDFKPDYIEGLDPEVPIGDDEGKAFCAALTVDISVAGTPYQADPPTCLADGVLRPQTQPEGVTATQDPAGTGPGTYTITFAADPGFLLTGPTTQTITVLPQLTGEECDEPPPVRDVCPNIAGNQAEVPDGLVKVDGECAEIPDTEPEPVPTAVAAGLGGSGPTITGSSPIDLLAQMLVGGGLALLMAAGWLQIGRQTQGEHQN